MYVVVFVKEGPIFLSSILKQTKGQKCIMAIFLVLWSYLSATNLRCLQKNNFGHTNDRSRSRQPGGQYQSRDNYTGGLSTLKQPPQRPQQPQQQPQISNNMEATLYQPYHTRADSKVSIIL